jgi:hypothetical protein
VVVDDPEVEGRRLFVKAKNNLSTDKSALSYTTSARKVGVDEETGEHIRAPYIEWGSEYVKVTATEAMQAEQAGGQSDHAQREAREFLLERLADGPVKIADLLKEAKTLGISQSSLKRAKRKLGLPATKEKKLDGEWSWEMPHE